MSTCPVCREHAGTTVRTGGGDWDDVVCPRCGTFSVSGSLDAELAAGRFAAKRPLLVGLVRERSEAGSKVMLTSDNIDDLLEAASAPADPIEAAEKLLLYLANKSTSYAAVVKLNWNTDFPVVYGKDSNDLGYVVKHLGAQGLIEHETTQVGGERLTPEGWERVRELRRSSPTSTRAFVAMWFDSSMDGAWKEGFERALKEVGFDPIRVDLLEHNEKICDRILMELRRASLVVADITGNRHGVYFEAGFAMAMGTPVIWTARESDFEPHFDTRQFNHVLWTDPADLRVKLSNRVLGTIGKPADRALS